jgi:hypothetical protein
VNSKFKSLKAVARLGFGLEEFWDVEKYGGPVESQSLSYVMGRTRFRKHNAQHDADPFVQLLYDFVQTGCQ